MSEPARPDRTADHRCPLYACVYEPASNLRPPSPERSSSELRSPASDLVSLAADFSPRYEQHRADLVSIDVRGLSRLLGTPRTIGAELRREAASRGMRVHVAVAPTRMAALVLALARPGLTIVGTTDMADALSRVPLAVLEQLPDDPVPAGGSAAQARLRADDARLAMAALKRWGVRTLGDLAALPPADLAARLGRGGRMWQAVARGEDIRPLVPMQPDERFDGTMALEWPIEGLEPLSFVLTRLLEPLSTRLERRDRGAAVLYVQLGLVTRDVHVCRLELPSPLREVRALRTLALLQLESHPPPAAIDAVTIVIEPTPGRILQHTLFTRPHPTPERLSTLLARLGALMGQDRIGAPRVVDTHRPGAFAMVPFAIEHRTSGPAASPQAATSDLRSPTSDLRPPTSDLRPLPSALRRCRQPVPARVSLDPSSRPLRVTADRRGFAGGAVMACAGPWRTSGAWWEHEEEVRSGNVEVRSGNVEVRSGNVEVRSDPEDIGRQKAEMNTGSTNPGTRSWNRDEWDVALADGAVYRIFRNCVTGGWFIDAILD
jgi:protein ImuB